MNIIYGTAPILNIHDSSTNYNWRAFYDHKIANIGLHMANTIPGWFDYDEAMRHEMAQITIFELEKEKWEAIFEGCVQELDYHNSYRATFSQMC